MAARSSPLLKPAPRAAGSGPTPPLPRVVGRAPRPAHAGGHSIELCGATVFIPRTSILVRVLAAAIALLIFIQAVSCGAFFCVALPFHHHHASTYVDVRDIVSDAPVLAAGAPPDAAAAAAGLPLHGATALVSTPKLIPRVIHQTYRSKRFPGAVRPLVRSWRAVNGDAWEVRFYDDVAAMNFVRREFPEYLEAYLALPKDVERADFFKYMVVLRMGGAYADIDTECRQPLDGIISPVDTLVVGWDAEVPDHAAAGRRLMARQRQLLPWFFAAAPGHPALRELCDRVARNAHQAFSNSSVRDTQERTGQGVWTDVVLRHATNGMAAKASDPWRVRILPRIAFGVNPAGYDGLTADLSDVVVLHHFLGSWETKAPGWGWGWGLGGGGGAGGGAAAAGGGGRRGAPHRKALQILSPLVPASWVHDAEADAAAAAAEPPRPAAAPLFPVSAAFDPPFTVMTHLAGEGDAGGGGEDVSAAITRFGGYQPGLLPTRRPSLVEALVGSLGPGTIRAGQRHMPPGTTAAAAAGAGSRGVARGGGGGGGAPAAAAAAAAAGTAAAQGARGASPGVAPGDEASRGVFVDVGAGEGFFTLAAAARGHRVLAFESSPLSLEALKAGIAYNSFESLVQVVSNVTLGARSEVLCVPEASGAAQEQQQQQQREAGQDTEGQQLVAGSSSGNKRGSAKQGQGQQQQQQQQQQLMRRRRMERRLREDATRARRGYVSAPPAAAGPAAGGARCPAGTRAARRAALSDVLGKRADVATLRIAAHGHEGWVLEGLVPYLTAVHRPHVIYVEFSPAAMRAAGWADPAALVETMRRLGYADAAHAGRVCDARWGNVTAALRSGGAFGPTAQLAYHQPTWCKLRADGLALLVEGAEDAPAPENILFILSPSAAAGGAAAGAAGAGGDGAAAVAAAQGAAGAAAGAAAAAAGAGVAAHERGGSSA